MEQLWRDYHAWATPVGDSILSFMDPSGGYKLSATASWPLADFSTALAVAVAYLAFVLVGTVVMKAGVPAINITALQFIYNPLQILICSYMCVEAGAQAYRNNYTFMPCNPYNQTNPVMGNVLWLFYASKSLDFMATVFIILGKKWKQLSLLHVYHHFTVWVVYWLVFRVMYDGEIYMTILLNGAIHTIMYMYYFVSAHTKTIWWKQYLTVLQLAQFLTMNVQGFLVLYKSCPTVPLNVSIAYMAYVQSLFWLFVYFFITSYCVQARNKRPASLPDVSKKQA
ncbi:hypothetical protein H257_10394 [Aphanomyces astaci]|uniref:Elongation of fatty acids protein n=1 Tax=Aphanomyces astaci TaxID=112090 RepID=W4G7C3_APHAT|nr:hypothetical protein H257_10394 [Aphanomyces astaci]ETV75181.1 hypothetical protein H257_10394 [Aphanomyces astaci]|eukprot:XP_009835229.1 hypothetical protein H257_10394 [Aphanomyces astaci]